MEIDQMGQIVQVKDSAAWIPLKYLDKVAPTSVLDKILDKSWLRWFAWKSLVYQKKNLLLSPKDVAANILVPNNHEPTMKFMFLFHWFPLSCLQVWNNPDKATEAANSGFTNKFLARMESETSVEMPPMSLRWCQRVDPHLIPESLLSARDSRISWLEAI